MMPPKNAQKITIYKKTKKKEKKKLKQQNDKNNKASAPRGPIWDPSGAPWRLGGEGAP